MIYCVEDERNIRELLVYTLHSTGFEAKGLENGEQLFEELGNLIPDLILLDIMLPCGRLYHQAIRHDGIYLPCEGSTSKRGNPDGRNTGTRSDPDPDPAP